MPWLLLFLACGDEDGDTGTPAPAATLADALADRVPAAWTQACVTWVWEWDEDSEVIAFEPVTGERVTLFGRQMGEEDWDVHGLSWDGTGLVTSGDASVARLDLATGAVDRPTSDLRNVVAWGDRLLAEHTDESWWAYGSFEDAVARRGGEAVPEVFDERLVVEGDYAWTAQPMTDTLKLWNLPTGAFGDLPLDGFEGYVFGMALLGDEVLLLNDGRQEKTEVYDAWLYRFDRDTGAMRGGLDLGVPGFAARGLACTAL